MVLNDFQIDYKRLLKQEGKVLENVASTLGVSKSAISARAMGKVMNPGYIEICDALGYDIEVRYIRREK